MKIFTSLLFILIVLVSSAQKNKNAEHSYFVFNEKEEPCKIEDATYAGILEKISDSAWQWQYYNFFGPIISIETYSDQQMTIPHGYFALFDENGKIDSSGYVVDGRKDSTWYYYDDSLHIILIEEYEKGILKDRKTTEQLKKERFAALAKGLSADEKEATFAGGEAGWRKYLEKNFKIPERAINLAKNGTGMFAFTVETDGSLKEIRLLQSVEYSFDDAMLSLLKTGPKWQPALKKGQPVKAYRKQPMTIRIDNDYQN